MVEHDSPSNDEKSIPVRRGRVDSVNLYEVKEEELELLEKGSPATVQFNFAVALFSTAITCLLALLTSNFKWQIAQIACIIIIGLGFVQGTYFMISWWRNRTPIANVVSTIRNRINGNSIVAQVQEEPETQPKNPENDEEPRG